MAKPYTWRQWEKARTSIFERAHALFVQRKAELLAEFEATYLPEIPAEYQERGKRTLAEWLETWQQPRAVRNHRLAEQLSPRQQLYKLTDLYQANWERLEALLESCEGQTPTFNEAQTIRTYTATAETLQRQMDAIASTLDMAAQWADDRESWYDRKRVLKRKVYKDYRGKGQVYDMLCDRLASLQVGLERLEAGGQLGTDQYRNLNEQWVNCVTQIQRHTESLKVEDVSPYIQQIGEKFMRILEGRLALTQPGLLVELQKDIYDNVIDGRFEQGQKVKLLDAPKSEALTA